MTFSFNTLRERMQRNAAYRETLAELSALPLDTKLDLDIAGIESQVAYSAVYGREDAYRKTLEELDALPIHVKLDLDIAGIEDQVAHRAVYGRSN